MLPGWNLNYSGGSCSTLRSSGTPISKQPTIFELNSEHCSESEWSPVAVPKEGENRYHDVCSNTDSNR